MTYQHPKATFLAYDGATLVSMRTSDPGTATTYESSALVSSRR
jgi:hypothetical protein